MQVFLGLVLRFDELFLKPVDPVLQSFVALKQLDVLFGEMVFISFQQFKPTMYILSVDVRTARISSTSFFPIKKLNLVLQEFLLLLTKIKIPQQLVIAVSFLFQAIDLFS